MMFNKFTRPKKVVALASLLLVASASFAGERTKTQRVTRSSSSHTSSVTHTTRNVQTNRQVIVRNQSRVLTNQTRTTSNAGTRNRFVRDPRLFYYNPAYNNFTNPYLAYPYLGNGYYPGYNSTYAPRMYNPSLYAPQYSQYYPDAYPVSRNPALNAPQYADSATNDKSIENASAVSAARVEPIPKSAPVEFKVTVPPDAEVWFEGTPKPSTGPVREFETEALKPGEYTFAIKAEWISGGKKISQTQEVTLEPGDKSEIRFPYQKQGSK